MGARLELADGLVGVHHDAGAGRRAPEWLVSAGSSPFPRVAAQQAYLAGIGAQQREQDPNGRPLTGAVGSQEPVHLTGLDHEVQTVQCAVGPKTGIPEALHDELVLECSGALGTVGRAIRLTRRGGTTVLVGFHARDETFDLLDAVLGEKTSSDRPLISGTRT
jgi:threonine dehydrogenase-like Zn-dependent dehydrogenase